jgi:ribonuclease Z
VSSLRVIAPELPFEIHYREITEPEQIFEMDGYRLKAFRVKHNVICYGYTIEIDRAGKFDVQRATEQKIPKEYWKHLQKGETVELDGRILTPEMVLGPPRRGISLPIVQIQDRRILSGRMQKGQTCLSAKECTEKKKKRQRQ